MSNNVNLISQLPEEVTLNILSFLKVPDLAKTSQVCQTWHRISADESLWKSFCQPQDLVPEWPAKKCVKKITQPLDNFVLDTIQEFVNKVGLFSKGKIEFKFSKHPECSIQIELDIFRWDEGINPTTFNETIIMNEKSPNFYKKLNFWVPEIDVVSRRDNWENRAHVDSKVKLFKTFAENQTLNGKIIEILNKRVEELKKTPLSYKHYFLLIGRVSLVIIVFPIFAVIVAVAWSFQKLIELFRNRFFTPQESSQNVSQI